MVLIMDAAPDFNAFGSAHVSALIVIAIVSASLPLLARRLFDQHGQHVLALVIAIALVLSEISKIAVRTLGYDEPLAESLPLHLCGIAAFLMAWVLWRYSYSVYEVAYFWGIGGSLPALLTPDLPYDFPHPFFLIFFGGHGLIILGVLYATLGYGYRPRWHSIGKTITASLALIAIMIPVNLFLDSNYLYLCARPEQATLIDYFGPWPWYVPVMFAIGLALCLACYAPFAIAGRSAMSGTGYED